MLLICNLKIVELYTIIAAGTVILTFRLDFHLLIDNLKNIPIVYTNDQEQIFLFKLAYANILNIHIETVITHAELETDK